MDNHIFLQKIGETIRAFRVQRNISQEVLANKANVHRTYVGMVERGEKNITVNTLRKFVDALGITLKDFFKKLEE